MADFVLEGTELFPKDDVERVAVPPESEPVGIEELPFP